MYDHLRNFVPAPKSLYVVWQILSVFKSTLINWTVFQFLATYFFHKCFCFLILLFIVKLSEIFIEWMTLNTPFTHYIEIQINDFPTSFTALSWIIGFFFAKYLVKGQNSRQFGSSYINPERKILQELIENSNLSIGFFWPMLSNFIPLSLLYSTSYFNCLYQSSTRVGIILS